MHQSIKIHFYNNPETKISLRNGKRILSETTIKAFSDITKDELVLKKKNKKKLEIPKEILRKQIDAGMSLPQMAALNDCPISLIRKNMDNYNFKTLEAENVAALPKDEVIRMIMNHWSCKDIAKKYNISCIQLGKILKKWKVSTIDNTKAKNIEKQDIIDMYQTGASTDMLSEIFDLPDFIMRKRILELFKVKKILELRKENINIYSWKQEKDDNEIYLKDQSKIFRREYNTNIPDDLTIYRMVKIENATLENIASDFGIPIKEIKQKYKKIIKRYGQHKGYEYSGTNAEIYSAIKNDILKLKAQGLEPNQIANKIFLSIRIVKKILQDSNSNIKQST